MLITELYLILTGRQALCPSGYTEQQVRHFSYHSTLRIFYVALITLPVCVPVGNVISVGNEQKGSLGVGDQRHCSCWLHLCHLLPCEPVSRGGALAVAARRLGSCLGLSYWQLHSEWMNRSLSILVMHHWRISMLTKKHNICTSGKNFYLIKFLHYITIIRLVLRWMVANTEEHYQRVPCWSADQSKD